LAYIIGIIGIAVILYLIGSFRVLRQYERGVVFFLGKCEGVRGPGLTLIFVPIQQMMRVRQATAPAAQAGGLSRRGWQGSTAAERRRKSVEA
jgi:regulator of protease activity HflC (stomatin/prohibitin superfamily)